MSFTLNILGTASARPVIDRNPSAHVLSVHGRLFLIDCGEGTQMSLAKARISYLKIGIVCISHIHGDHIYGIFGLLSTMDMLGRTEALHIYAPEAFGAVLKFFMDNFSDGLKFEIVFHPLVMKEPETVFSEGSAEMTAFPLNHRIDTYGFLIRERVSSRSEHLRAPRSFAYCSDTAPFPELAGWVAGVDLLYHEATFPASMSGMAASTFHSTTLQAAQCALDAGVGRLVVGHYSSRITDFSQYLAELRSVFAESYLGNDGDVIELPEKKL